jgi:hypothetical protein
MKDVGAIPVGEFLLYSRSRWIKQYLFKLRINYLDRHYAQGRPASIYA